MALALTRLLKLFAIFYVFLPQTTANPDAKRLYDDLLSTYNRLIRPVSNNTETVLVKLGLRLSQLIDLVRSIYYYNIYFDFLFDKLVLFYIIANFR